MNPGDSLSLLLWGYPPTPEMIDPHWPAFIQSAGGLHLTAWITGLALVIGLPLGWLLAWCRQSRPWLALPAAGLATWVRATPILVLALFAAFLPFQLTGARAPVQVWAVVAFAVYAAAYMSETFRSGMHAVTPGIIEVARTLGMGRVAIFIHIILPIACRTMVPALVGIVVTVFKDTSVLVVISAGELMTTMRQAQASAPGDYLWLLAVTAALYWTATILGDLLVRLLESRTDERLLVASHALP